MDYHLYDDSPFFGGFMANIWNFRKKQHDFSLFEGNLAVCRASRIKCIKIHDSEFLFLSNCARTKGPQEPVIVVFMVFSTKKAIKTYKCNRLLGHLARFLLSLKAHLHLFQARSLLRFAHKTLKNRRLGDFLPCKLRKEPDNRGFFAASSAKNPQAQQAARTPKDAAFSSPWSEGSGSCSPPSSPGFAAF
jgi:hypothetical protein